MAENEQETRVIKRVGNYSTSQAYITDCTVCKNAKFGTVIIDGVCLDCLLMNPNRYSIVVWDDGTWKIVDKNHTFEYELDLDWLVTIQSDMLVVLNDMETTDLDSELKLGKFLATRLAYHLRKMKAELLTIPVEIDGENYTVAVKWGKEKTMNDTIEISGVVASALSKTLGQDFNRIEQPERMAWIVLLLKKMLNTDEIFPHGKWATIQSIENQLDKAANAYVLEKERSDIKREGYEEATEDYFGKKRG